ncbi:tetratricopeptide repeat protein [Peteryoungia desertarenae]|uniref:Tetratricopeptide repeat protein n=1 Tax=Peteryoungia desertarenae TaxID=1813451 RepID=A0ABX6QI83_9HYPH|nr:tetratricopeptide repeat protein [Peteryoungia desertarenae]QLF68286.1 tetratricopeptide repeat protein [Peteryoungia desertarenae]
MASCPLGQISDPSSSRCIDDPSAVTDEGRLKQARVFIDDERFAEALALLDQITAKNNARYFNYRGFATRKLGRPEEAVTYYKRALLLSPYYVEARAYLGEAYLMLQRPALAREELRTIAQICGVDCEAYQELAEAIRIAGY